eukprot:5294813-Amphidinium_carterae.1
MIADMKGLARLLPACQDGRRLHCVSIVFRVVIRHSIILHVQDLVGIALGIAGMALAAVPREMPSRFNIARSQSTTR